MGLRARVHAENINASDRVQTKPAQFPNSTKDSDWETLAQHRTIVRICAVFKWMESNMQQFAKGLLFEWGRSCFGI